MAENIDLSDTVAISHRLLLQRCNLNEILRLTFLSDVLESRGCKAGFLWFSWANGFVMNGQKIIDRGEIIDSHTYNIHKSLEKSGTNVVETVTEKRLTLLGQTLFVALLIGCFMIYLDLFGMTIIRSTGHWLLFVIIVAFRSCLLWW